MTARETIASAIFNSQFGGTTDPTIASMMESIAFSSADAALAALDEAGMVVVPREPTEAMQVAGAAIWRGITGQIGRPGDKHPVTAETYRAMISAATAAP